MDNEYFKTKEEAEAFAERCNGQVYRMNDGSYRVKYYWDDLMFG